VHVLAQQLANGLSLGVAYALIASGYALIYSIMRFSNFAHGSFLIVGAYTGLLLARAAHLPLPLLLLLAAAGGAVAAMATERLAYRPIRARGGRPLFYLVASMGVSILVENLVIVILGAEFQSFPVLLPDWRMSIFGVTVSAFDLLVICLGVAVMAALEFWLNKSRPGRALRAAADDLKATELMGVDTNRLLTQVFAVAGALAGIAGLLLGMRYTVYPGLGAITLKAFVGAILGGLGSIRAAIAGALMLGLLEIMVTGFISSGLRDVFVFGLLILVLLVRPMGLFGRGSVEKV
jgi:branched-chain amino acid transport system permease protein